MARTMPSKSPFTKVTSALSMATSVPVPIAIPTSASARAGASLMPSPAIATFRPSVLSALIRSCLSSGLKFVDPQLLGDDLGRLLIVPGEHDDLQPQVMKASHRFRCRGLDGIGD